MDPNIKSGAEVHDTSQAKRTVKDEQSYLWMRNTLASLVDWVALGKAEI